MIFMGVVLLDSIGWMAIALSGKAIAYDY